MSLIPTFLVTRPIHISKAGPLTICFCEGRCSDKAGRHSPEGAASSQAQSCIADLWASDSGVLGIRFFLGVWEKRLECLGAVVNKTCFVGLFCQCLPWHLRQECIPITGANGRGRSGEISYILGFRSSKSVRVRCEPLGESRWVRAGHMCCCVNPTGPGWFLLWFLYVCLT